MMTQENQTGKKPGEDFSYPQGKKQIYYERIEVCTIELRPLTSYYYIE